MFILSYFVLYSLITTNKVELDCLNFTATFFFVCTHFHFNVILTSQLLIKANTDINLTTDMKHTFINYFIV